MTTFNLNHLCKGLVSKYSHTGVQRLSLWTWMIQSTTNGEQKKSHTKRYLLYESTCMKSKSLETELVQRPEARGVGPMGGWLGTWREGACGSSRGRRQAYPDLCGRHARWKPTELTTENTNRHKCFAKGNQRERSVQKAKFRNKVCTWQKWHF